MSLLSNIIELGLGKGFLPIDLEKDAKISFLHKDFMRDGGFILAYSPSCTHCVKFFDAYNAMNRFIKENGINFAMGALDISDRIKSNDLLANYYEIAGVPTLFYTDGKDLFKMEGPRDPKKLLSFIAKMKGRKDLLKKIEKAVSGL